MQATSDPVSLLSDAFSTSFSGLAEVDDFLKASIEERLSVADLLTGPGHRTPVGEEGLVSNIPHPIGLRSLQHPWFNNMQLCSCQAGDHATLLHFAASHGLTRLASSLLSLGHSRLLKFMLFWGLLDLEHFPQIS